MVSVTARQLEVSSDNKVAFGSVNANREYFETGVKDLSRAELQYRDGCRTAHGDERRDQGVLPDCRGTTAFLAIAIYHSNFNPSCTCREVVAVDVIMPAVGEGLPVAAA